MINLTIRSVCPEDLEQVVAIEAACFPTAEAATRDAFRDRITAFPDSFLVAETADRLVGFINGCGTNSPVIYDELFYSTRHHLPSGENLAIFGLDVIPEYRRHGIAFHLMKQFIQLARSSNRRKIILTCKENLISYYQKFGYVNEGESASNHGGAQWFNMTLTL
ncbi:MAG TPA: GNAT family N-acetyltransferase [Patescibacteria group bacterium]|nr:GNAT family N-acetyltransferase [Patescibacteria group bacterium]